MSGDVNGVASGDAATLGGASAAVAFFVPPPPPSVEQSLFEAGADFDFFQAVSVLEAIYPDRRSMFCDEKKRKLPLVKFVVDAASSVFAASAIREVTPATGNEPTARIVVNFMGLTGPSGVLPAAYTDLIAKVEFEGRGEQKYALRDWFDLFNHRLLTLFYRAWKKYRPHACYRELLRKTEPQSETDPFTSVLRSVCGFGLPAQSHQIAHIMPRTSDHRTAIGDLQRRTSDSTLPETRSSLLRYASLLAQRPRCASNLQAILSDYFSLPIHVQEFCGNWLTIDETAQSRLGIELGNCRLGENAVVGDQVWERQNRIVIRVGALQRVDFLQLLPDYPADNAGCRNKYRQMCDIVRLFVGPECDFDLQLVLEGGEIPVCRLDQDPSHGMRLGWNAWLPNTSQPSSVDDALLASNFAGQT